MSTTDEKNSRIKKLREWIAGLSREVIGSLLVILILGVGGVIFALFKTHNSPFSGAWSISKGALCQQGDSADFSFPEINGTVFLKSTNDSVDLDAVPFAVAKEHKLKIGCCYVVTSENGLKFDLTIVDIDFLQRRIKFTINRRYS